MEYKSAILLPGKLSHRPETQFKCWASKKIAESLNLSVLKLLCKCNILMIFFYSENKNTLKYEWKENKSKACLMWGITVDIV